MVSSEECLQYSGLVILLLLGAFVLYKTFKVREKITEGIANQKSSANNYKPAIDKLENNIKLMKNVLNVSNSRNEIEDILTDLSSLIKLAQLNSLLQYANGKMDSASTKQAGDKLESLLRISKTIDSSTKYLDNMNS